MYLVTVVGLGKFDTYRHDLAMVDCTFAEVNDYEYTVVRDGVDITDQMKREARAVIAEVRARREGAA